MSKAGSLTFGTVVMKTDEVVLMAEIMTKNGQTVEAAMLNIEAIDDMLGLQQSQLLIMCQGRTKAGKRRKNNSLSQCIEGRIDLLVDQIKN